MTLDDIEIDDVGLTDEEELDANLEAETYEKPWLSNEEPATPSSEPDKSTEVSEGEEDLITIILKDKGINPNAIKFQTETGEIEEKDFNELSREEQLQILNYEDKAEDNYGLVDEEVNLINEIRGGKLSVDEYKEYIGRKAIEEYLANNSGEPSIVYEIDFIPDDELYIADLKAKVPELTEEEMAAELELAKQNETLYQKKVQGIRNEYKQKEEMIAQQEEEERMAAAKKDAEEFERVIVDAIQQNDTIDLGESSLTLSEDDMNEIASFILDSDVAGVRHIAKALNDPETLVGMAWYALKGKEAFSQIQEYYKHKITEVSKTNYTKGFEDAKAGRAANGAKAVVKKQPAQAKKILTIDDLD